MHPAYLDLQDYVDAADDQDRRAAHMAARTTELLDDVLAELAAILPAPVQVLRFGTAGDDRQPVLVADLAINGTQVKARSDGSTLRVWVAGTELPPDQLAVRLGPAARRRLFRGRNPSARSGSRPTAGRLRPTSTS